MCCDLCVGEAGREGVAEGGRGQVARLSLGRRVGEIEDIVLAKRQGEIQDIVLPRRTTKSRWQEEEREQGGAYLYWES